ncbi:uncharacterized protein LOC143177653 [Calliopsis andreniformis]|uniref:uncharacterized protein LOC143177653 n=1 Tax=Calliopsis andreniformis TaxID=337506 RepID=UPI003FCEC0C4
MEFMKLLVSITGSGSLRDCFVQIPFIIEKDLQKEQEKLWHVLKQSSYKDRSMLVANKYFNLNDIQNIIFVEK